MKYRTRTFYTDKQKSLMWDRWEKGETLHTIASLFDRHHPSVARILGLTGGIRPPKRTRSKIALTLSEREEISRGIATRVSIRAIAAKLSRSLSTVSREINRNGGYYTASAEQAAWDRALRTKSCKLKCSKALSRTVAKKLQLQWSPQQIAGWLKKEYPGDEGQHVSHETIYKTLFIQAHGALKKELLQHLRTKRIMRRSKQFSLKKQGLGGIVNAVSIHERPASVEDLTVTRFLG